MMVFDVETSGVNPFMNAIVSVTLKVYGTDIIDTFYIKPNNRLRYEQGAFDVNGLDMQTLNEHGIPEPDAASRVTRFIKNNFSRKPVMLGHNVLFDIQFMNALFMRNNIGLFNDYCFYHPRDTMIMLNMLKSIGVLNIRSISLVNSYKHFFGESFDDAHNSESDVIATEELYDELVRLMQEKLASFEM